MSFPGVSWPAPVKTALGAKEDMAGFLISVNGKRLASVSNEGLNIFTVQVHGDVLGVEFAEIEVYGGHYGEDEKDKHLIWVSDYEISPRDEVEIVFLKDIATSHQGKTIEELHPESERPMGPWQPIEEIFKDLAKQPRLREEFTFELATPDGEIIHSKTGANEFSFHFSAMWRWLKPDEARVSLTSNTLEGIAKREAGSKHASVTLQYGQGVTLRVGT